MVWFLGVLCVVLTVLLGVAVFYALRWARIIFLIEDDLAEAIAVHQRSEKTLEGILKVEMFFDNLHIKKAVDEALADVRMCMTATHKLVFALTQRSQQKYIRIEEIDAQQTVVDEDY